MMQAGVVPLRNWSRGVRCVVRGVERMGEEGYRYHVIHGQIQMVFFWCFQVMNTGGSWTSALLQSSRAAPYGAGSALARA